MNTAHEFLPLDSTATPADEAAVAEAVCQSARSTTAVYPLGGGTMLRYGVRPTRPGVGLSLGALRRVIDYPADDMTITVEAGVTLTELARCLAEKRQRLPIDIADPDRATIGGAVAANPSGPRRYGYGTLRDYVLGLRAVDGCGTIFSAGGRVVKNAAGYNMCRLLVGSLGTLGVVTQATLMVRPLPETSAMLVCDVQDFAMAERLLDAFAHTETLPAAVELLAGRPQPGNPVLGPMDERYVARLLVGFEGPRVEVQWMSARLGHQWRDLGVTSTMAITDAATEPFWQWLTCFPANAQITVPPSATVAMIAALVKLDPSSSIQAHAGNGVICLRHAGPTSVEPAQTGQPEGSSPEAANGFVALLRERLRPEVAAAGGTLVVRSYTDHAELTCADVWGPPDPGATLMRAIKERFDPQGILNPGRFVF